MWVWVWEVPTPLRRRKQLTSVYSVWSSWLFWCDFLRFSAAAASASKSKRQLICVVPKKMLSFLQRLCCVFSNVSVTSDNQRQMWSWTVSLKSKKIATGARLSTVYSHAARMLTYALMMTLKGDIFLLFPITPTLCERGGRKWVKSKPNQFAKWYKNRDMEIMQNFYALAAKLAENWRWYLIKE